MKEDKSAVSLAFRKLRVYARLTLIAAIALVAILVLVFNRNHRATVWFFHEFKEVNVVWMLVVTGLGSVLTFWVSRGLFHLLREVSRIRKDERVSQSALRQQKIVESLEAREKRLDARLRVSQELREGGDRPIAGPDLPDGE